MRWAYVLWGGPSGSTGVSRLLDKILKGAKPADLPESSRPSLSS